MISHLNMISEIALFTLFESHTRTKNQKDTVLGLLPYSHVFGLSVFNSAIYRGESVVVMPKFELAALLRAIERCKINVLYVVSQSHLISACRLNPELILTKGSTDNHHDG